MSEQQQREEGRPELPIENGFPIERVNEIAAKEGRARQHYRPIYTMHKWWARRPGCLFRAISLYSLLDETTSIDDLDLYEPGENQTLGDRGLTEDDLLSAIGEVDMENPEPLWDFYPKDVRIKGKKVLDPFMGALFRLADFDRRLGRGAMFRRSSDRRCGSDLQTVRFVVLFLCRGVRWRSDSHV
jgi:putative DNA methylase